MHVVALPGNTSLNVERLPPKLVSGFIEPLHPLHRDQKAAIPMVDAKHFWSNILTAPICIQLAGAL
jgi:hypothetical protein